MEQNRSWFPVRAEGPMEPVPAPTPDPAPYLANPGPIEPHKHKRAFGGILAAIVAFLAKFKAILLLLPKLKLLTTSGTMLVSLAAYALLWGWQFAAGFIALLFVHEMGHVIQLRREGIRASAPMFIPFLGAVISARSLGDNALAEARVGLAGPVLGTLGSAACILVWHVTGNDLWRALAFTGFFLNLFNLLPVVPLDGGRAMAAMTPWMWFAGLAAMVALAVAFPNPIILLIVVFAGFTGGEIGLTVPDVLSVDTDTNYYIALIFMLVSGAILFALSRSPVGLILQASGQDAVQAVCGGDHPEASAA